MLKVSTKSALKGGRAALLGLLLSTLVLVPLLGCGSEEGELTRLRVVSLPYVTYTTFYIAEQEGYFEEQGLDVEFVKFSASPQAVPLLAQGSLDVVAGAMSASLMNAVSQNMNVRIVAGREYIAPECSTAGLVVRKDLYDSGELDTIEEIKGRTVTMAALASLNHFMLTEVLETAGLTLDDVDVGKLRPQDTVVAFENGAIEAAIIGDPHRTNIEAMGYGVTLLGLSDLLANFQQGYLVFGPSLLDERPEVGERFMVAYLQAARQWNEGKTDRNVELAVEFTELDEETLRNMCWNSVDPDGQIVMDDVLGFQDWAYDNGFVDERVDEQDLFEGRFIDYATGVLGPAS